MRICMISYDFLPNPGGIAAHVFGLSKALACDGHDVIVFTWEAGRLGIRKKRIENLNTFRIAIGPTFVSSFWFPTMVSFASYIQQYLCRGWDVVHWHTADWLDTKAACLCKAKVKIFTNHSSTFVKAARSGDERRLFSYVAAMNLADAVIAPSRELETLTEQVGIPHGKLNYIPNGVDPHYFQPVVADRYPPPIASLPATSSVVLAVRRMEEKNGLEYLVKAWPKILCACPNAVLLLVGDGSLRKIIQNLAHSLGIASSIRFLGTLSPPDVAKFLKIADLVVLPSLIEATSISGLEAMSSGKALVGTDVGGIPEIIEHGRNGLLVPPANSDELASAVIKLLKDKGLRDMMGRNGRARVEREFSWHRIAERTVQVYQEALVHNFN